ncbi:GTP cyclohydrolase I FolE2 [bacterium]|nr:GTP cyclohydrolase I FolE2 [bacterium]
MAKDIQKERPSYRIPINKVGIRGLRYPISVLDREHGHQNTVAQVSMFVDLPGELRGTHMSRFVEILNGFRGEVTYKELEPILRHMQEVFDAECAHLEMVFPYFCEKRAPVTKASGYVDYEAIFEGSLKEDHYDFLLGVRVPITTLCPCSKELSRFGAHNQRGYVTLKVRSEQFIWLEELIEWAEGAASAPIYSVLKRDDEKEVTEQAYLNPRFVEDVVRAISERLGKDSRITWFRVEAENMESIHNHNAYAIIEKQGPAFNGKGKD